MEWKVTDQRKDVRGAFFEMGSDEASPDSGYLRAGMGWDVGVGGGTRSTSSLSAAAFVYGSRP